ncbi:AT hook domain-containing protein [Colletotrichum musicola]|uniref:Structure-specific endonuclease subunit SLX4 n=1 Tax=Colletotrichum musicola TaxID=2175873 RepID=A0A8H6KRI2_9PEZI|nr:AT hook domain-containing protein [Colletotrichum musicola]
MASPFRSTRHDPFSLSSSPGLPSLDQIKSQIPRRPPIRSSSAALPVPEHANPGFTSASGFFREEHPAIDLTTPCKPPDSTTKPPHEEEEVTVISLATLTSKPKKRKGGKVLEKKAGEPTPTTTPAKTEKKPKAKSKAAAAKKGETISRHFAKSKDKGKDKEEAEPAPAKKDPDEPLALEAALRRRKYWTPPPADTSLESKKTDTVDLLSSVDKSSTLAASKETFENLFENFGRPEDEPTRPSAEPPEVSNQLLRKRKRIEAVSINNASKTAPAAGATKAKAPRKKPRTITELATAAYVLPDASEEHAPTEMPVESVEGNEETTNGKKKKKRPSRAKPKKIIPPEPVLLSPTAALRQAANQDYVFGTSSQLAREQSPTFLRDLQAALRASNSRPPEEDPFVTPINSDAAEPTPRKKLWGVGARDEDGRVLDLEVINLADTPQANAGAPDGPDPFGYAAATNTPPAPPHLPSEDSFPDIDDLLSREPVAGLHEEQNTLPADVSRPAADGPTLTQTQAREETPLAAASLPIDEADFDDEDIDLPPSRARKPTNTAPQPSRPNFDLYTDNQLAREISSYGFKPVKRRQAMLALLDQCWSSKQRTALSSLSTNRPISTAAKPEAATPTAPPEQSESCSEKGNETELSSSESSPGERKIVRRVRPKKPLDELSPETLKRVFWKKDFDGRPESKTEVTRPVRSRGPTRKALDELCPDHLREVLKKGDLHNRPESKRDMSEVIARWNESESDRDEFGRRRRAKMPLDQLRPSYRKRVLGLEGLNGVGRPKSQKDVSEDLPGKSGWPKKPLDKLTPEYRRFVLRTEGLGAVDRPESQRDLSELLPKKHGGQKKPLDELSPEYRRRVLRTEGWNGSGRPPSRRHTSGEDSDAEFPYGEPPPSAQPRSPSPRSRGRGGNSEVIEIPDSASECSYRSFDRAFSSPPLSDGEDGAESPATSLKSEDELTSLFTHITEAITSVPPTTDPKKPTFHEMILMYDPVVLEDLAAWLNTGELSRVGFDGEVSAADVKLWCESKSVLCLWRAGLKGQARKRF